MINKQYYNLYCLGKFFYASPSIFLHFLWFYQFLLDCNQTNLIGDGYCNDEVNILDCGYDGGDCCGTCINTRLCTDCACIGNVTGNGIPNALVGDGFCNDETNTQRCNFDGGDCCLSNIKTDYCTNCKCHYQETCTTGIFPSSVGDGYCNDETNTLLLESIDDQIF